MEKKRDKFAKLRSKKCSKIDAPQITNFFTPKIISSTSGAIGSQVLSQGSQKNEKDEAEDVIEIDDESSKSSCGSQPKPQDPVVGCSKNKGKKRGKMLEKRGPRAKAKKLEDDQFLNELLIHQSMAENINPDDLQLALALSRSIADTQGECSTAPNEDCSTSSSQSSKSTAKFTLEEYGFKSNAQYNKKVMSFLGMEKELRGFRKMSLLLHRNPKKQDRLFREKIKDLLDKSIHEREYIRKPRSSYHFLVVSENLLQWQNTGDGIMAMNSNADPTSEIHSLYYSGNLVEPSHTKIDALLRNWDEIPGREISPIRARRMQESSLQEIEEDLPGVTEEKDLPGEKVLPEKLGLQTPERPPTPDILESDESTLKIANLENESIEISSDEEITSERSNSQKSLDSLPAASILHKTNSKSFLDIDDRMLQESVIVIESDDETEINQSINKILDDHQETKHLARKSISDGFIFCRNQQVDDMDSELPPETNLPLSLQSNISSLLTDEIIHDTPPNDLPEDQNELTFVSESLKNEDISVIKRRAVTPPPNYNAMTSEEIQQELKKYGLKAIKGQKARILLEHIYNQLHPFIQVEDRMFQLKSKYGLIDVNTEQREVPVNKIVPENVDVVCRDNFLGDLEARKCILPCPPRKKLPTCALPLHIAFYNYMQCNREIHEKILQYQPVSLELIQEHFKSIGIKYENNDLIEFLDKTCITFQGPNSGSRTRKKPSSPKKTALTKSNSSRDCGE